MHTDSPPPTFHKMPIKRAELGTLDKVREELEEAIDAESQNQDILLLIELSDIIGAVEQYTQKKFGFSIDQLLSFSRLKAAKRKEMLKTAQQSSELQQISEAKTIGKTYDPNKPWTKDNWPPHIPIPDVFTQGNGPFYSG